MKVIKNTIKELPENYSWDDIFSIGIGVPTGTQNMFKIYFEIPKLKSQSHSTETGQPKYTLDQIRQAGKEGEVNHLDVEHIIDLLKEQPNTDCSMKSIHVIATTETSSPVIALKKIREISANSLKGKVETPEQDELKKAYEIMRDKSEYWKARCEAAEQVIIYEQPKYSNYLNEWQQLKQQPI